ncbi:MAG: hypothetical protein J2P17_10260 [Mycobacterium sp.]|nr:hypothetical protein [Mycobacterium sp.]
MAQLPQVQLYRIVHPLKLAKGSRHDGLTPDRSVLAPELAWQTVGTADIPDTPSTSGRERPIESPVRTPEWVVSSIRDCCSV